MYYITAPSLVGSASTTLGGDSKVHARARPTHEVASGDFWGSTRRPPRRFLSSGGDFAPCKTEVPTFHDPGFSTVWTLTT